MFVDIERLKPLLQTKSAFHSFQIFAGSSVNANDVAFVDEDRRLKLTTGFGFDRFANVRRRVTFGTRFAVRHDQVDMVGWRHDDRLAIEEGHLAIHVVLQVLPVLTDLLFAQFGLLVRFLIHKNERVALPIQELHIGLDDVGFFERIVALERAIQRGASQQVLQLANVHRVAFAWLLELHRSHDVRFAIDLNFQAFTKVLCFVRHGSDPAVWIKVGGFRNSDMIEKSSKTGYVTRMQILTTSNDSVGAGCDTPAEPWQRSMKTAIRTASELLDSLKLQDTPAFRAKAEADFPVFAPQPFLQRIRPSDPADPLLRQILPVEAEDVSPSHYSADPLAEAAATLQPGLLQKYHGRILVVATGACAIHCRYCFRRHFPYGDGPAGSALREQLAVALQKDESLEEVILSGGDPLTLVDDAFAALMETIENVSHVKRLRIHTRLPIVIPQRVNQFLAKRLGSSRLQKIVVVHVNHANEIDQDVENSLRRLANAGATLLNQSVLLKGVNDSADALVGLSQRLLDAGALPYYLHQLDPVIGAAHFEVPIERGRQLIEAIRARLPGYAVPRYVQEIPGEPNKTVIA